MMQENYTLAITRVFAGFEQHEGMNSCESLHMACKNTFYN